LNQGKGSGEQSKEQLKEQEKILLKILFFGAFFFFFLRNPKSFFDKSKGAHLQIWRTLTLGLISAGIQIKK
jgi:hypothetical protein